MPRKTTTKQPAAKAPPKSRGKKDGDTSKATSADVPAEQKHTGSESLARGCSTAVTASVTGSASALSSVDSASTKSVDLPMDEAVSESAPVSGGTSMTECAVTDTNAKQGVPSIDTSVPAAAAVAEKSKDHSVRGGRKRAAASVVSDASSEKKPKGVLLEKPGTVFTLGENDVGQLGLGPDVPDRSNPTAVPGIPEPVIAAVAGGMHTACVTVSGKVYTFGCNDEGALGRSTVEDDAETTPGVVDLPDKAIQVSAGDSHTAVLTESGRIFAWGTFRDASGSMGLRPEGAEKAPVELRCPGSKTIVKIASGSDHFVCLTSDGTVYTAGCAEQGQLGRVAECFAKRDSRKGRSNLLNLQQVHYRSTRKRTRPLMEDVWAGTYVTFSKAKDTGDIYAWGLNNYYQLGLPDMINRFVPELVSAFPGDQNWQAFAGGQHHTVALNGTGAVYTVGRGTYGQLGLGNTADISSPERVQSLSTQNCIRVAASSSVSFAVTESGKAFSWGMNTSKQLGGADEDDVLEAREMRGKQIEGKKIVSISSGGQHTVILASQ